jgi:hypothetical protein
MISPPRKNGDTSCWRGDIISMRQTSSASGGTVTRLRSVTNFTASRARSRTSLGLLSRRHVRLLHLLERGAPVVAEAHLPRRLLLFGFDPRELAFGERDQLGGVYAIISASRSAVSPGADRIADDRLLLPSRCPTTSSRMARAYRVIASFARRYGSAVHHENVGS